MKTLESLNSIICKEKEGMFQIILNRPPMNAFNVEMMEEINYVLGELRYRADLKILVFSAAGNNFCGSIPIKDFSEERSYDLVDAFNSTFHQLQKLDVPILSMAQGLVIGTGFEIILLSDLVLATESAKFGLPQIKMGFFSPVAASILQQNIPQKRAAEMMLTGELISSAEAEKYGLINAVVPNEKLQEEAGLWVSKLLQSSAAVIQLAKKAMVEARFKPVDDAYPRVEEMCMTELLILDDHREGIKALTEKRKPVWKNC